jgi:hypothetical protein
MIKSGIIIEPCAVYIINIILPISSYLIYPIRGGAIIGVFMIQAYKGAFMGYIGLLLNAPYKIDSMVWMSLWMRFVSMSCFMHYSNERAI